MGLRKHQRRAVEAAVAALADGGRAQVVMACGTGKTLVGVHAARLLADDAQQVGEDPRPLLVLVPSLALLAQTLRVWRGQGACGPAVLAVCSDEAVEHEDGWDPGPQVAEQAEVTTDPARIAAFLAAVPGSPAVPGPTPGNPAAAGSRSLGAQAPRPRTVFATYHSAPRIAEAYADHPGLPAFAVAVFDEAHRVAADPAAPFATALHDTRIPVRRRLFLTATPRIQAAEPDHAPSAAAVHPGMADESLFGPRVFELPVAEAIESGLLSDYQVLVVGVDDTDMHRLVLDNHPISIGPATLPARSVAAQIALGHAAHEHRLRRVIVFCSRVNTSRTFATALPHTLAALPPDRRPHLPVRTVHLDGETPAAEREHALDLLRQDQDDHWTVLSNVRVLGEGVDCPSLDAVMFCDPRTSQTDVVQAVGRAIRLHPERPDQPAVIILPVYLGRAESAEAVLEWSAFRHIWQVLSALRDHDARLGAQLRRARQLLALGDGAAKTVLPDRIRLQLPADLDERFATAFTARVLDGVTSNLEEGLARLRRYTEQHGTARPHTHYTDPDGFKLGRWAAERRKGYARGLLDPQLAADLEALPGWNWNVHDDTWTASLEALHAFAGEHGHLRVPRDLLTGHGVQLANWLHAQRTKHIRGRLPSERAAALQAVPGWRWNDLDERWQQYFKALQAFADQHGHAAVPGQHTTHEGLKLGSWVSDQRRRQAKGKMTPERVAALDSVPGWGWTGSQAHRARGAALLAAWQHETGSTGRPPVDHVTACGFKLGSWVLKIRGELNAGTLSDDDRRRVGDHPAITGNAFDRAFEVFLAHLRAYADEHGHARPSAKYAAPDGYRLGDAVTRYRHQHKYHRLSPERAAALDTVPGWTWSLRRREPATTSTPAPNSTSAPKASLPQAAVSRETNGTGTRAARGCGDGETAQLTIHSGDKTSSQPSKPAGTTP